MKKIPILFMLTFLVPCASVASEDLPPLTVQQMAMSGVAEVDRSSAERALEGYATMVEAPAK